MPGVVDCRNLSENGQQRQGLNNYRLHLAGTILDRDHDSSSTDHDGKGQVQDMSCGHLVFIYLIFKIKRLSHLLMYGNRRDP